MTELAFLDAIQTHQAMLFRVAYTILHNQEDCADALQDALEKAWRKKDSIRSRIRLGNNRKPDVAENYIWLLLYSRFRILLV